MTTEQVQIALVGTMALLRRPGARVYAGSEAFRALLAMPVLNIPPGARIIERLDIDPCSLVALAPVTPEAS